MNEIKIGGINIVTAEMWERFLEGQKIKEKRRIEKEEAEKKYKEEIKKYAIKRKLERVSFEKEKKPKHIKKIRPLEKPGIEKPEERLKIIEERLKELREEEIIKLEKERKLEEQFLEIEKKKKRILRIKSKRKLCGSLQEIVSKVEDPESIFKDIDFVREYTGCKIPAKKKEEK